MLEAFARRDLTAAAACFDGDGVYREAHQPPVRGREAIAAEFARYAATGAAWSFAVDDVIVDGLRACVVYRFAAGGGDGRPARERAGCATVRLAERGSIAEWREYEG